MKAGRLCDFCLTEPADPEYREIVGFTRARSQGGANRIIARKETGRIPCRSCVVRLRDGVPLEQQRLAS